MSPEREAIGKLKSKDYLNCASSQKAHSLDSFQNKGTKNSDEIHGDLLIASKSIITCVNCLAHSNNHAANILGAMQR